MRAYVRPSLYTQNLFNWWGQRWWRSSPDHFIEKGAESSHYISLFGRYIVKRVLYITPSVYSQWFLCLVYDILQLGKLYASKPSHISSLLFTLCRMCNIWIAYLSGEMVKLRAWLLIIHWIIARDPFDWMDGWMACTCTCTAVWLAAAAAEASEGFQVIPRQ